MYETMQICPLAWTVDCSRTWKYLNCKGEVFGRGLGVLFFSCKPDADGEQ